MPPVAILSTRWYFPKIWGSASAIQRLREPAAAARRGTLDLTVVPVRFQGGQGNTGLATIAHVMTACGRLRVMLSAFVLLSLLLAPGTAMAISDAAMKYFDQA